MKKQFLLLIFMIVYSYLFAQEKNDSKKTQLLKYYADFSIYSDYNLSDVNLIWQSDLAFGFKIKRHNLSLGITGGPNMKLYNHYDDNNAFDYLAYDLNYNKWGIFGGNISYQFQINKMESFCRRNIMFYSSILRYVNKHGDNPNSGFWTKQMFHFLIGYSSSRKFSKSFSVGTQILSGLLYNADAYPFKYSNSDNFRINKLFPVIMIKVNVSYEF